MQKPAAVPDTHPDMPAEVRRPPKRDRRDWVRWHLLDESNRQLGITLNSPDEAGELVRRRRATGDCDA